MNSADIETMASSKLKESLISTGCLSPYINEKDKEPIWDGNIYIYSGNDRTNDSLIGRIPVQVKGKKENDLSKKSITYPVRSNDLVKYLNDGGVVFFVVCINDRDFSCKIYFKAFFPYELHLILNSIKKQKTKSIEFKEFPADRQKKIELFLDFFSNKKKQAICISTTPISMEAFLKYGGRCITFSHVDMKNSNPYDFSPIIGKSMFFYGQYDNGIILPISYGAISSMGLKTEISIICNNNTHYHEVEITWNKGSKEICWGKSFKLVETGNDSYFSIEIQGTLKERIRDLSFLLDLAQTNEFSVFSAPSCFKINTITFSKQLIDKLEKNMRFLNNTLFILHELGVEGDLDLDVLSKIDYEWIRLLNDSIIKKQTVRLQTNKIQKISISRVIIGNLNLLLGFELISNDLYRIFDFLKANKLLCIQSGSHFFQISRFHCLTEDDFKNVANINYADLVEDIINMPNVNEYYLCLTTNLVLDMLHSWDKMPRKNASLLSAATNLSQWLLKQDDIDSNIALINYLQCVRRTRQLTNDELDNLCRILNNHEMSDLLKICAHILMGNFRMAKFHYSKLSIDSRNEFDTFPICSLW